MSALLSTLALCFGCGSAAPAPEDIRARVDEYMNAGVRLGRFSSAVLVARGGTVLVSNGYGVANYEEDVPILPYTKFRIASVTKPFTAMAILILEERGALEVDDPVSEHLADCPAAWERITIHHLLTHTAGIPDYTGFPDSWRQHKLPTTVAELLARFRDEPLSFEPGESFRYSNSDYAVLGAVIEQVSGKSYADFLRQNIFDPLGMKSTGYDDATLVLKHRARGYERRGGALFPPDLVDMSNPFAAGGLYSTVEDLYLWSRALAAPKLLSEATLKAMATPFRNDYAYGLVVTRELGRTCIGHSGAIGGFTSFLGCYPEED